MKKILGGLVALIIIGGLFSFVQPASAHPGRTDKYGCHTCRTNCKAWGLKNGQYHCHNRK